ncbi:MAG: alpha-galactosidase [Candidatus Latescibacterota bacterium]
MDESEVQYGVPPLSGPGSDAEGADACPFSFVYDGQPSEDLLPSWRYQEQSEALSAGRRRRTQTFTDPRTGLEVRRVLVTYADFPTIEWTLYFRHTGTATTPIVEGIQALDIRFGMGAKGGFLLHHNVGSPCQANDYQPLETPLEPGDARRFAAAGGRPTNSDLSYFNLEWSGQGVIVAIGWPGQWAATFARQDRGVRLTAGQETTHFRLHPGEEVRSPLIALQRWQDGDWVQAQNVWRRWMLEHSLPRPAGQPVPLHYGSCFGNMQPFATEEIAVIDGYLRERIPLEFWFIDAGWYPGRGAWTNTGTWEVDEGRFPKGLREVADHVHAHGMKFVVWFEPERVTSGSWLAEHRPEWVLGGREGGLLNLGDPQAWAWTVERISGLLTSEGIDVYRQDFNMDPLSCWQQNDAEDRQGITEIKHVTGYLALWDELLRRHPGLWIDTCASGGRRNDLETLRRSVPLLRSDFWNDTASQQAQTMGIAPWMPYFGSGMVASDLYWFRSCICPASRIGWDARDAALDYDLLRRMIDECHAVQRYQMGDFYPLTPYSLAADMWVAWQWHSPQEGAGVIQAFRRGDCPEESIRLNLRGLDAAARYTVRDADEAAPVSMTGDELHTAGLPVASTQRPAALLVWYEREE